MSITESNTSPVSGSTATPGGTSDQTGATQSDATSAPQSDAMPSATSAEQPGDQGSTANANQSKADDAFDQFTRATTPTDTANGTKPSEDPAQQVKPEDKAGAEQAPTKPDEGDDEHALDNLPTDGAPKDLRRALKSRRKIKEEAAALSKSLETERSASDRLFARLEAAGIEPDTLPQFLGHLGRAKHGDAASKEFLRNHFGIESATPAASGFTEEQVREAIGQALDHYDTDRAIAAVKAKGSKPTTSEQPATSAPIQQTKQPTQPQAVQPQQPQRAEYGMNELKAEVNGMAAVLRTTYGTNAGQVTQRIEQKVQQELQRLTDLKIRATPEAVAGLYREALGAEQTRQVSNRQAQPNQLRPSSNPPPQAPKSADAQFEAYVAG